MRTFIPRAVALAAAVAAVAVPAAAAATTATVVFGWTPTTSPGGYNYGTLTAGQTAAKTFTLANTGTSGSSALKITLAGSSAFTKTADTCTGTSLGPRKTCTVTITYTAPAAPGHTDQATLTATSTNPKATATLALAGAAAKAAPAITTTAGPGGAAGSTVTDTATLTGGYQPTGTIEFQLYATPDCSGSPVDDETLTVTGNGTYTTPTGATPAQAGTYSWTARYSGDTANTPAATPCGTDTVTLTKAAPAISQPRAAAGGCDPCAYGVPLPPTTDTATLSGGYQPTGTIEFKLYSSSVLFDCSGALLADETVTVTGNGPYTAPDPYTPTGLATDTDYFFNWTASYSGDANNNPAATGCRGGGVHYFLER
jgi:hypothetical protein